MRVADVPAKTTSLPAPTADAEAVASIGRPAALRRLGALPALIGFLLAVGALYWAQAVLIPVALAILLTFLLTPIVSAIQRAGLGRVPSVTVVVVLAFSVLAAAGWAIALQVTRLADDLPSYRHNYEHKISDLRSVGTGTFLSKVQSAAHEVLGEIQKEEVPAEPGEKPVPVVVTSPSLVWQLPSLLGGLASAGLVFVLVIFMLLERQELRNRLIRLIGYGRVAVTTKALDEAGSRITRYIGMQSLINSTYGLGIVIGLLVIGLPYALLWGFLAAALRFIPYVGSWIGTALPFALSLGAFPGWFEPLLVAGLFVVLELACNMLLEPLLYGRSAGVSQVALLVTIAFWTWLWGPIGLILATPMTVCLVVLSKHVPELEFIYVLMTDEPVMEPDVSLYQRLLAGDEDEATELVEDYLGEHSLEEIYDGLIIPALSYARRDHVHGKLGEGEERFVVATVRDIVDELGGRAALAGKQHDDASGGDARPTAPENAEATPALVLGVAAASAADELGLGIFRQLVAGSCCFEVGSRRMLTSEIATLVEARTPAVVCIAALPPGGLAQARYICKRLRARFPNLKLIIGRWGPGQVPEEERQLLSGAGADGVGATLLESRTQLLQLLPLAAREESQSRIEATAAKVAG